LPGKTKIIEDMGAAIHDMSPKGSGSEYKDGWVLYKSYIASMLIKY
jgi:hypothetical protein